MKPEEARDIVALMKGCTKTTTLTPEREAFWQEQLSGLDAETATLAVLEGRDQWEFFPSWSEFAKIFQAHARRRQQERESAERQAVYERVERERAGVDRLRLPLWLKRWYVARFVASPADLRRFPEQGDWGNPDIPLMPVDAHVELAERLTDAQALVALRKAFANGMPLEEAAG